MSDEISVEERRSFFRLKVPGKVEVRRKSNDELVTGSCVNVSANGLLFAADRPLEVEEKLSVELHSNDIDVKPLRTDAKVVRVNRNAEGKYLIGLSMIFPDR